MFRQSVTYYSGLVAPKVLIMATTGKAKDAFRENVARQLRGLSETVCKRGFILS